jgi:hypothetical protein
MRIFSVWSWCLCQRFKLGLARMDNMLHLLLVISPEAGNNHTEDDKSLLIKIKAGIQLVD